MYVYRYIFYFRMHIPSWHFNSHEQGHCLPGLHRQQDACGATGDGCQALESRWKVEPISRKLSLILGNLGFQKDHIRIISAQNGNKRLPSVTLRIKSGESKWTWEVHPRYVEILNQLVLQFPTCNVYHTISYDIIMAVLPSLCDSPCLQTTRLRKIIFMGVFIEFMHSNNRMAQVLSNRIAWHFASHIAILPSSWFSTLPVRNISQLHERIMEDDDDDSEAEVWDQKGPQIFLHERHERVISCDWGFIIIDDSFQSQAFSGLQSWQFRDKLEMSWPLSRSQKICPSFCLKVGSQQGEVF